MDEAIENPDTFAVEQVKRVRDIGLFLKATSSLIGPSDRIELVHEPRRTDHEVELAVVIGTTCRNVTAVEALNFVAGYAIGLDITLRGVEERSLRKSPDTYSVLGPWLVTADEIPDPGRVDLSLAVDGVVRQKSNTSKLLVGVPELIELASSFYTLYPGDIIFTGTPEGVGPLLPGEQVRVSVAQIGEMTLHVSPAQLNLSPQPEVSGVVG